MRRIVVVGATGFTGRLVVEALCRRGARPVLAGRSEARLREVAREVGGGLEVELADVADPPSIAKLVDEGDVLVSTVGPFGRWGDAAVDAALEKGAHYLDSNGEPAFTRRVFESAGPLARRAALLTAFGWECVCGNLAGALALREAGEAAVRVDTGYFYTGRTRFSAGTRASFLEAALAPSFAYRDGAVRTVRGAERYRTMVVGAEQRPAVSLGASEHFSLPRVFPELREVNAYLGWLGGLPPRGARALHLVSRPGSALLRAPAVRALAQAALRPVARRTATAPTSSERRAAGVHAVALAYDRRGEQLAEVHLTGIEGYELTGELLAWGATRAAAGAVKGVGALGPVEAFGLEELERGCREAGLARAR